MKAILTKEQALAILPAGDTVHTFYNNPVCLVGADWSKKEAEDKINQSDFLELTGPGARGLGHGLCAYNKGATQGDLIFIQTDEEKLVELEKKLVEEATT